MTTMMACARAESIKAARAAGTILSGCDELDVHFASCGACRALAQTIHPNDGTADMRMPFPVVDPGIYELGPAIACGGMGRIRIARDLRVGRIVAMKELLRNLDVLRVRFVREARVASHLQHPNIVPIYDVGCWPDGTPFYTMRLVSGRTLHEAIVRSDDSLGALRLLPHLLAAADAVAFAHANGVVHRDITPANILIGDFGETVVIDWGLAKELRIQEAPPIGRRFRTGATAQQLTLPGQVIGSAPYMPVEQANGQPVDKRADVYALGAVLYHLLAGRPAYVGHTSKEILDRVRAAPAPLLAEVARVPAQLAAVVDKAMSRDASDRHADAGELAAQLRSCHADMLAGSSGGAAPRSTIGRWLRALSA